MSRLAKIISNHVNKAQKEPNEHLIFTTDDNDMKQVYCLVRNLDTDETPEWKNGVFLVKLIIPDNFPVDPPKFMLLNENGVYAINTSAICISIGHFHKDDGWRPVLGLAGFAREIANGMMHRQFLIEKGGLNLLSESAKQIASHSKSSLSYLMNKHQDIMLKLISEYEIYSKKWDLSKVDARTRKRLEFGNAKFTEDAAAPAPAMAAPVPAETSTAVSNVQVSAETPITTPIEVPPVEASNVIETTVKQETADTPAATIQ